RGNAEVQQHPRRGNEIVQARRARQALKGFVNDDRSAAKPRQPLGRDANGLWIGVEAEQTTVRTGALQNRRGVASRADGTVDKRLAVGWLEKIDRLLEQYRPVQFFHV